MSWERPIALPEGVQQLETQIAGHSFAQGCLGLLKSCTDGAILKPTGKILCGLREIAFYEQIKAATEETHLLPLRQLVPQYFGHPKLVIEGKDVEFIRLEDLAHGFAEPCVMDVKIGRRTWDPLATPEKRKSEEAKYKACRQPLGLCIPGFQVYSIDQNKLIRQGREYGKQLTTDTIVDAFRSFLNVNNRGSLELIDLLLQDISLIHDWARTQTSFRLYSSSVLLVYDAQRLKSAARQCHTKSLINSNTTDTINNTITTTTTTTTNTNNVTHSNQPWAVARMIDFAHVFPADDSTIDSNYLEGVESLIKIMKQVRASCCVP